MATSDISICARALVNLGASPITSFSDGTDAAQICNNVYPGLKERILSAHPWRFAMKKTELTRATATPVGEWEYKYLLPPDRLGNPRAVFFSTDGEVGENEFEIFGRELYANATRVWVDYTANVDEAYFPAFFADLMIYALCADIGFAITDQQNVADYWYQRAYGLPSDEGVGGMMGNALANDAQGSGNVGINNTTFVDARFGGSGW